MDYPPVNETDCIDWNQYYTECTPGEYNPFSGAISFDNIGLAWVAIFLVRNHYYTFFFGCDCSKSKTENNEIYKHKLFSIYMTFKSC